MEAMPRQAFRATTGLMVLALCACGARGGERAPTFGWRGNWTGLFPDTDPPTEWGRIARGVVEGMTCQSTKPSEGAAAGGQPVREGFLRDWLVAGPFDVTDSVKDFGAEQIPGEAALAPAEGDLVKLPGPAGEPGPTSRPAEAGASTTAPSTQPGPPAWKRLEIIKKPDYERWGTTELDWVDLMQAVDYKPNRVSYACTYLYCRRAGDVTFVVDHAHGLKAWVNGKVVYDSPERAMGLGSYVGISRQKQDLVHYRAPKFQATMKQGWNRLLVKVGAHNRPGWREMRFAMRLYSAGLVPYDQKNIVWMTELPERTNACPVIVGDRIFTPAEPDELLCLDKRTGNVLWRRFNDLYDAIPAEERLANPVFKEKIDPLAEQRATAGDYEAGLKIRREIRDLLIGLDKKKYKLKWDGHLASHFGIVGFTTTPVTDGQHVWAFYGQGVVACYDMQGNRKWIRRLEADQIAYSCAPALVGGRLITVFGGMHALDAATGRVVWSQLKATSIASLIPATIRGTDVVFTRQGQVHRASDGKLLWSNPHIRQGDTGWGAPVVLGETMYLSWLGISNLIVADFSGVTGEDWKPSLRVLEVSTVHRRPNGEWLDRWTAGSPLIYEGTFYGIDQYGVFYAMDLKTGKTLYRQDVGFDEMHTYNAIGVGASAALGGKHIYVVDNQGVCVVLEPGPTYKPVAVNRIETVLPRDWPAPPQEMLANGPPVFDGDRMYIRGEQYLYCIGRETPQTPPKGGASR